MRVWHVGGLANPDAVNGINFSIWQLATAEASLGLDVSVVVNREPSSDDTQRARARGISLRCVGEGLGALNPWKLKQTLSQDSPDIVHMRSVFRLEQATLAWALNELEIPYVVHLGGGLSPDALRRNRWLKWIYGKLIERPRIMKAKAIGCLTPQEVQEVGQYLPDYQGQLKCIPIGVFPPDASAPAWNSSRLPERPTLVYLGRADVNHKGIDILFWLATAMPEVLFHLYCKEEPENRALEALLHQRPQNLIIHKPVYGSEKSKALCSATMYIQMSRWEGFGISVAEAMFHGVPCAIAETMALSQWFREGDLGLLVTTDIPTAVNQLRMALNDIQSLERWSEAGRQYATEYFSHETVAKQYVSLYSEILGRTDNV